MHSATTGRFITSDYYMKDYPGWWKAFYESKPQNKYFGQTWSLLLPEEAYARSVSDDRPWTTKYKDLGTRFPHPIVGGAKESGKAYYGHLEQWSILPRDGAQCRVLFSI